MNADDLRPQNRGKACLHLIAPLTFLLAQPALIAEGLSQEAAEAKALQRWNTYAAAQKPTLQAELQNKAIQAGGQTLKILERRFGEAPPTGHALFISMHGGGGGPASLNDQQWQNQIRLYAPTEGIVVAPRAPGNTWDLWHQQHIDPLFDRLIQAYVIGEGVDPNRVYLMGYSAGGDGVFQLAPRMADRFAAASMMAGHPNETQPSGLRNLPFAIFMGGQDAAYKRNQIAGEWKEKLAALQKADPEGYMHQVTIYADSGHWMNGRDAAALPWMLQFTRNPWPLKMVWRQDNVLHNRLYWLGLLPGEFKEKEEFTAEVNDQTIALKTEAQGLTKVRLYLHDRLVDLDRPLAVTYNGRSVFTGIVTRSEQAIQAGLLSRPDLDMLPLAILDLPLPASPPKN